MSELFNELKRRNVIRVAIAYAVVGWLIIEVIDTIAPRMAMPEWVPGFFIILVLVGFPIALLFSWAFEMTPQGLKKTHEVDADDSITHSTGRKLDFIIIATLVIALGYFVWDKFGAEPALETGQVTAEVESDGLLSIADRITISSGSIDMAISISGLLEELIGRKKAAGLGIDDGVTLVWSTPWHFQRFSNQKRIVTTGDQKARPNTALIRALGKAWGWRKKIQREGVTIKDIASSEDTTPRYVRRLLQLAWLAPDIMESILDGKQPARLTLEPFRADQPIAWQAQRAALGFDT